MGRWWRSPSKVTEDRNWLGSCRNGQHKAMAVTLLGDRGSQRHGVGSYALASTVAVTLQATEGRGTPQIEHARARVNGALWCLLTS